MPTCASHFTREGSRGPGNSQQSLHMATPLSLSRTRNVGCHDRKPASRSRFPFRTEPWEPTSLLLFEGEGAALEKGWWSAGTTLAGERLNEMRKAVARSMLISRLFTLRLNNHLLVIAVRSPMLERCKSILSGRTHHSRGAPFREPFELNATFGKRVRFAR